MYTYAELDRASRTFGRGLREMGVETGDRVAMLDRSTVDHAVAYFGALRADAIPAALHFRKAESTICEMVEKITPTTLVFQSRFRDVVDGIRNRCDSIETFVALDGRAEVPSYVHSFASLLDSDPRSLPEMRRTDRAFINFSSGTTGVPKPVVHTHENIVESAHAGVFKKQIGPNTRTLKTNTPSFIAWANATFSVLNAGATIVYLERSDPEEILGAVEAESVTSIVLVPTVWKRILSEDLGAYDLESVQRVGYAGAPLDVELFSSIRSISRSTSVPCTEPPKRCPRRWFCSPNTSPKRPWTAWDIRCRTRRYESSKWARPTPAGRSSAARRGRSSSADSRSRTRSGTTRNEPGIRSTKTGGCSREISATSGPTISSTCRAGRTI